MGLFINTNQSALNAQRKLTASSNALGRSFERLSSGLRINGAKDDAAGLSITNRLSSQIRGLNQAARNSNDGISLAQTAEGALAETTTILQRVRELAVQSANDTNNAADRASLQAEVSQLIDELDRIASTTNFNGNKLIDGSFLARDLQVGANVGETLSVSVAGAGSDELARQARYTGDDARGATKGLASSLSIEGTSIRDTVTADDQRSTFLNSRSAIAKAAAINDSSDSTGVRAIVGQTEIVAGTGIVFTALNESDYITINNVDISGFNVEQADATGALTDAINAESTRTGVIASQNKDGYLKLTAVDGRNIHLSFANGVGGRLGFDGTEQVAVTQTAVSSISFTGIVSAVVGGVTVNLGSMSSDEQDLVDAVNSSASLQSLGVSATLTAGVVQLTGLSTDDVTVSATSGGLGASTTIVAPTSTREYVAIADLSLQSEDNFTLSGGAGIGFTADGIYGTNSEYAVSAINISSREGAIKALDIVDLAIEDVSSSRAALGALQNRLESTINNLSTASENLAASRSRIMDADFAVETASLSRSQIIQQAGVSILAQANQQPQIALALLR